MLSISQGSAFDQDVSDCEIRTFGSLLMGEQGSGTDTADLLTHPVLGQMLGRSWPDDRPFLDR